MITEAQAEEYLDAVDTAPPDEQQRMLGELREFRTVQLQQEQEQRDAYTRELFKDPETLGGHATSEMQRAFSTFSSNPKQTRAGWANTRFLANVAGISVEQAASSYDALLSKYSHEFFNGEPKDDVSFYGAVSKMYADHDAKVEATSLRDQQAVARGIGDFLVGQPPLWASHLGEFRFSNADSTAALGASPEQMDIEYGEAYMRGFSAMLDNPELVQAFNALAWKTKRTDLAQPGLYGKPGDGNYGDIAKILMEASPEARMEFFGLLPAYLKEHGEKDPSGIVNSITEAFKQAGDAIGYGVDSAWGEGKNMSYKDVQNERRIKELESGIEIRLEDGVVDLSHITTQGDLDRRDNDLFHEVVFLGVGVEKLNDEYGPVATPEHREQLLAQAKEKREYYKVYREVKAMGKGQFMPRRSVLAPRFLEDFGALGRGVKKTIEAAEMATYGTVEFAPVMAASTAANFIIPGGGFFVMADAFQAQTYEQIRTENPEISADDAGTIAAVASVPMAAAGLLRVGAIKGGKGILGLLPYLNRAFKEIASPRSAFWKPLLARTAVGTAEQMLDMGVMAASPAAVQHVMHALGQDVPDVDWKAAFGDALLSPETFFGALPFALVGAGVGTWKESRAVAKALPNPEILKMQGIPEARAHEIAAEAVAGRMDGAESLFREAWASRTKEDISRGTELQKEAIERQKVIQNDPDGAKIMFNGDRFDIVEPDGKVSASFESEEAAFAQLQHRAIGGDGMLRNALADAMDYFRGVRPDVIQDRKAHLETVKKRLEERPMDAKALAERMRIAGIKEGENLSNIIIKGETVQELREGVMRDVVKLYEMAGPETVVEEYSHAQAYKDLRDGVLTENDVAQAAQVWANKTGFHLEDPAMPTLHESIEALGQMTQGDFINKRKALPGLPSSIRAFIAKARVYFREVFGYARSMRELREAGMISENIEGFLARSLGIDEQVSHNKAVLEEMGQPVGAMGAFSVGRADYQGADFTIPKDAKVWSKPPVTITKVDASKFGHHATLGDAAKDALQALRSIFSKHVKEDGGISTPDLKEKIVASGKQMRHGLHLGKTHPHLRAHMEAAGVIDQLFENAVLVVSHDPSKGNMEKDPLLKRIHRFVAPLDVDGRLYRVKLTVKDFNGDNHHYYDHSLTEIEPLQTRKANLEAGPSLGSQGSLPVSGATPLENVKTKISIADLLNGVKFGELSSYPMVNPHFSIGRADYLTEVARSLDAMKRSPDERLKFAEKAKEKITKLSKIKDEMLADMRADGHATRADKNTAKRVEDLKAAHGAEVSAIDSDAASKMEAVTSKQEQNGIRLSAISKKNSAARRLQEEIAKATGKTVDRVKQLQALAELDGILMALPPEVRGKVGGFTKLAELKTDKARQRFFMDRLEKIGVELEKHLKEQYSEKLETLLEKAQPKKGENRIQKSTLGPEAQEAVSHIERFARMSEDEIAAEISKIEGEIEKTDDPKKRADLSYHWGLANQFGNLEGKTSSELADAARNLDVMLKQGRSQWKFQEEARLADVKAKKDKMLAELKHPYGVGDSDLQVGGKRDRKLLRKVRDFFEGNLAFAQTLQEAFKNANSEMALHFEDRTRIASNTYTDAINGWLKRFRGDMRALLGVEGGKVMSVRDLNKRLASLAIEKNTGVEILEGRKVNQERVPVETARRAVDRTAPLDFTRQELADLKKALDENDAKPERRRDYVDLERVLHPGQKVIQEISELQAVHYLLSWDQTDVRARMERQGWTPEAIEGLRNWISDDAFKIMGWLKERYAEGYDRLNQVYRRMYGMSMPRVENYAPTYYDVSSAERGEQSGPMGASASQSGMTAGFIKTRGNHNARLERVDALAAFWRHKVQSEYWISWAETVREMRGVLGSTDVLQTIRAVDGAAREEQVKKWIKAFETNGQKEAGTLKAVGDFMNRSLSANAAIALGFKVSTLMKQASAMLGSAMDLPPRAAVAGWGRFLTFQLESGLAEVWKSETIQRRIESGYSPEVRTVLQAHGLTPSRFAALVEKGMYPVGAVDAAFTTISAAIAFDYHYREAVKAGMPEAHAKAYAMDAMDRVIHRTAQPAETADKSLNEVNANTFGKMMMLFKSEARQKFAISYLAAKRMARGEQVGANGARLFVTWALAQAVTQTMGNIYQTIFTDKENEEIWNAGDYARAMALGHLDGAYLAGPAISSALTFVLGDNPFPSKSPNPVDQIAADMSRKAFNPANWEDSEDAFKGVMLYLQIIARTGASDSVTGMAAFANAIKDAIGAGKNVTESAK